MNKIIESNALLISHLLHSRTQAHIFHFKTKSYAQHKALQKYYEEIVPLLDSYTEAFQGTYGIINNYKSFPISEDLSKVINYFKKLILILDKTIVPDTYLQNILQSIHELISKELYLLTNLN